MEVDECVCVWGGLDVLPADFDVTDVTIISYPLYGTVKAAIVARGVEDFHLNILDTVF